MNLLYYITDAAEQCPAASGKSESKSLINPLHKFDPQGHESTPKVGQSILSGKPNYANVMVQVQACVPEHHGHPPFSHKASDQAGQDHIQNVAQKRLSPRFESQLTLIRDHVVHRFQWSLHYFMQPSFHMKERNHHRNYEPNSAFQNRPYGLDIEARVPTYLLNVLQKATKSFQDHPSHNYVPFLGIALTENVLAMTVS
jgi:hypothetical protein